jgi:hypothetical protein
LLSPSSSNSCAKISISSNILELTQTYSWVLPWFRPNVTDQRAALHSFKPEPRHSVVNETNALLGFNPGHQMGYLHQLVRKGRWARLEKSTLWKLSGVSSISAALRCVWYIYNTICMIHTVQYIWYICLILKYNLFTYVLPPGGARREMKTPKK